MISSLPGKDLRTRVESRVLLSDSTCVLEAKPGKLDIKRREPGILFISLQSDSHTFQTSSYDVIIIFCVNSLSLMMSFKKVQRHDGLIKAHAMR